MSLSYYLNKILRVPGEAQVKAPVQAPGHVASSLGLSSFGAAIHLMSNSYVGSSVKLLLLGSIVETGRRLFRWLIDRFGIQYSTTVRFTQGDPAYEWIVLFLTQENVWRRSREFVCSARNSQRKWAVRAASDATIKANAEYVPTYKKPQLFRWRGYWVEIKRAGAVAGSAPGPAYYPGPYSDEAGSIYITIYTLDMNVLSDLVEDARLRYLEVNRPNVVIHLADAHHFGAGGQTWTTVKHKIRRPLSSIILPDGVVDSIMTDAQEFLSTENWYIEAGIPHRRGYLLHGPPGSGKTSTIYALAGALNLEIYSLSLASNFVDDSFLQRAASSIPKHGLFLIEDIDCAFSAREDEDTDDEGDRRPPPAAKRGRSSVTLSGLLNVIDGVGSEEGKLFFATTNYIDRLDAALLRPGRIDHKIEYGLATAQQAHALFLQFFPAARFPQFACAPLPADWTTTTTTTAGMQHDTQKEKPTMRIDALAATFAAGVPPGEFSTAELQGFLQGHKTRPAEAAHGAPSWVEVERTERRERESRKEERRARAALRKAGVNGSGMPNWMVNGTGSAPTGRDPTSVQKAGVLSF
ncbi:P-loop containing nucleoside triphosphate hydrolase protein [Mycena maculata]|uniref:P-loop containing nucleoside triphosphate hydrolase protein n=1 Tax=Mycena maculata TaxID=230809 RepID=A0AAD7NQ47_9AGAR|nr:P-loop containing nucleoside triphosphate hydrolase protein [Mycena maculata]